MAASFVLFHHGQLIRQWNARVATNHLHLSSHCTEVAGALYGINSIPPSELLTELLDNASDLHTVHQWVWFGQSL